MTKFNRRHFMAGSGALMGSSMLSAPNLSFAGGHLAAQELRTVGLSVTVQERILNDFKASSGIGGVSGKADIYPNTQTELLSGSKAYDCWETIGERLPAMTMTNTIEPIPTSKLSNWNSIRDTFTKADPRMEDEHRFLVRSGQTLSILSLDGSNRI